jgi:hypothetical protein
MPQNTKWCHKIQNDATKYKMMQVQSQSQSLKIQNDANTMLPIAIFYLVEKIFFIIN